MTATATRIEVPHAPTPDLGLPAAESVIETRNLTKRFGGVVALDHLDLEVPRAAIGLLGPNGAGKTTLIRLLLGLSRPTSGSASVLGMDTGAEGLKIRQRVGYMPESDVLPSNATAADFVGHMAEMSGIPKVHARQRAADVLYHVGLDEERYRLIKGFATGMKQRVKLAQAVVHDPSLVFLDEPTAGMDPSGRDAMLELILRVYRLMGMTVVLSSHILEDIERVCDYVIIINGGKLVLSGPIGKTAVDTQEIVVRINSDPQQFMDRLATYGIHEVRLATKGLVTPYPELIVGHGSDAVYDAIRDTAADLGVPLRSLRSRAHSLEEMYLNAVEAGALELESPEEQADGD
ncbi:ABC transporter ATP-binding protein [soil metagenome]